MSVPIPLTKGYTAWVDDEDAHLAAHKWCAMVGTTGKVYAYRSSYVPTKRTLLIHREVLGLPPGRSPAVDHKDGDGLNCRKQNLRDVTHAVNMRNLAGTKSRTGTGYLGVYLQRPGKYQASICVNGRNVSLGYFDNPAEAHLARLRGELEHWGVQPRRCRAFEEAGLC